MKYFMSYIMKLHYYGGGLSMEQEIVSKDYLDIVLDQIYKTLWSKDKFLMTVIKLRLDFFAADLS